MSELLFAFDEELSGETKTGGNSNFPKVGHAYIAEITTIEFNKGWINVGLKGVNYTAGQYDTLSYWKDGKFTVEQIQKLINNTIASNPKMKNAVGQKSMDLGKLANQGLQIGVVYKPDQEKNEATGAYEDNKWVTPGFSIAVEQAEDWDPDMVAYEAHRAKFWSDSDSGSAPVNTPVGAPVEDESELPF